MIPIRKSLALASLAALSVAAHADPFSFATWTATSATTATSSFTTDKGLVTATLTGNYTAVYKNFDVYTPAASWIGGIVGNAPSNDDAIRIDQATSFTLSFSQPVTNLSYDLWSVGAGGDPVSYAFTQPFSLVAGGVNSQYGGGALTQSGNTVTGQEGNGTLLFTGTYSTISWNVIGAESYQVFTIGLQKAQTTPEPAPLAALGAGALVLVRRRKKA